ncbi:MAG: GNAT family N-acetyltransferase [Ktedonobacteraceae bacterium]
MAQIRPMQEREAERVRDLWLQMCAEAGTPLPESSAQLILANLKQYASHQLVHCFVTEEQGVISGFVTCTVQGHPVMPGFSGEIEELYVQPVEPVARRQAIQADLVKQAVTFMLAQGVGSIHTRTCTGKECPEEEEHRAFWQSLGWENDMTIYSIYSNVPGDPALQRVWEAYKANTQAAKPGQQP